MKRDEIIRMAREAGFVAWKTRREHWGDMPFAKLRHPTPTPTAVFRMLNNFADLVAEAEREACAKVCEQHKLVDGGLVHNNAVVGCVAAVRARGAK